MNLHPILFLAQVPPNTPDPAALRESLKATQGNGHPEVMIIIGCAVAVGLILFIWAFFIRKRPKAARGSVVVERRRKGSSGDDASRQGKRKRRPDHPERWGRNPTLGETGGLPPPRPDETPSTTTVTETQTASSAPTEPAPDRTRPRVIRPN